MGSALSLLDPDRPNVIRGIAETAEHHEQLEKLVKSRLSERTCPIHEADDQGDDSERDWRLRLAQEQMIANGWCCHLTRHLSQIYDLKTFSYLATLKQSPNRLVSHERCTNRNSCIAYNTEAAAYQTRHTTADCTCTMVAIPYQELTNIIRDDKIPLISIVDSAQLELKVHARSPETKYIAISHVWADGLGNPHENALPRCQLMQLNHTIQALQKLYEESKGPYLFWMDTLCIPVHHNDVALKLAQINKMASIYKGALCSLVLDAELMSTQLEFDLKTRGLYVEARARIACSVWMSRSWTLQEGQLPSRLAIESRNDVIILGRTSDKDGGYLERSINEEQTRSIDDTRQRLTADPCQCVDIALERTFYTTFFLDKNDFVSTWNGLFSRTTTKSEDVPLIVTNIMDLKSRQLWRYRESYQRILAIILSLESPPLSIFFHDGERHDPDGNHHNRWVPREIGRGPLQSSSGQLSVGRSHLSYLHHGTSESNDQSVSVYIMDAVLPLRSTLYLRCKPENVTYVAELPISSTDQLSTESFIATCIIIDNGRIPNGESKRPGACFYVTRKSHSLNVPSIIRNLHLTYSSPLRVREIGEKDCMEETHVFNSITTSCKLKVKYEPLPHFSPLKKKSLRKGRSQAVLCIGSLLWIGSSIAVGVTVGKYGPIPVIVHTKVDNTTEQIYLNPLLGVALGIITFIALVPVLDRITNVFDRRNAWGYLRSYEVDVAAYNQSRVQGDV